MTRKYLIFSAALMLGACSISCSDRFTDTNEHLLDTAQIVYETYNNGKTNTEEAFGYQDLVENAYKLTVDGSVLCEIDEVAAVDKFEEANDILDAVEDALHAPASEAIEIKGE